MEKAEVIGTKAEKEQNLYIFLGRYYADDFSSEKAGDFVFIQHLEINGVNGVIKGTPKFDEYFMKSPEKERLKSLINKTVRDYIQTNRLKFMLEEYDVAARLGEN
ncbi:hypothetical protein [Bacillus massiliglaciei]|uniref:hypothetical protein n=1 Tax=Bacillus massiliglaciei TaxID=1816693 RepID=UPI000DA5FA17|nr:hypothetical protein [Bacillus massiliglaciei]